MIDNMQHYQNDLRRFNDFAQMLPGTFSWATKEDHKNQAFMLWNFNWSHLFVVDGSIFISRNFLPSLISAGCGDSLIILVSCRIFVNHVRCLTYVICNTGQEVSN